MQLEDWFRMSAAGRAVYTQLKRSLADRVDVEGDGDASWVSSALAHAAQPAVAEHVASCGFGVDRIGLAVVSSPASLGACDLDHGDTFGVQVPGEASSVSAVPGIGGGLGHRRPNPPKPQTRVRSLPKHRPRGL